MSRSTASPKMHRRRSIRLRSGGPGLRERKRASIHLRRIGIFGPMRRGRSKRCVKHGRSRQPDSKPCNEHIWISGLQNLRWQIGQRNLDSFFAAHPYNGSLCSSYRMIGRFRAIRFVKQNGGSSRGRCAEQPCCAFWPRAAAEDGGGCLAQPLDDRLSDLRRTQRREVECHPGLPCPDG